MNLYLTYSGVVQDSAGGFFQVSNLHNILMIPFFVTMMYCFKVIFIHKILGPRSASSIVKYFCVQVFFGLTALKMKGSNPRWRAGLLFQMFALCKTFEGIISVLEGNYDT